MKPLHAAHLELLNRRQNDLARGAERGRGVHSLAQVRHQLRLVAHRILPTLAGAIDGRRIYPGREDARVIHDHAAVFAGEHPVGARDGLHQRVIPHRLVEIHRGTARRVETGQPHGTDEHQSQRVVGVLQLLVQRRL